MTSVKRRSVETPAELLKWFELVISWSSGLARLRILPTSSGAWAVVVSVYGLKNQVHHLAIGSESHEASEVIVDMVLDGRMCELVNCPLAAVSRVC